MDTVAQGRTNPPPDKIPWSTFRTISPYMEDGLITILIRYVTLTHLINNCYQLTAHIYLIINQFPPTLLITIKCNY